MTPSKIPTNRLHSRFYHGDHQAISYLYDEEGWQQRDIASLYQTDQGYISRIINTKAAPPLDCFLLPKYQLLQSNIHPQANENKRSKSLRAQREKLHSTKLSWKKATKIREAYFSGKETQAGLAKQYGVSQCTIHQLLAGKTWKQQR